MPTQSAPVNTPATWASGRLSTGSGMHCCRSLGDPRPGRLLHFGRRPGGVGMTLFHGMADPSARRRRPNGGNLPQRRSEAIQFLAPFLSASRTVQDLPGRRDVRATDCLRWARAGPAPWVKRSVGECPDDAGATGRNETSLVCERATPSPEHRHIRRLATLGNGVLLVGSAAAEECHEEGDQAKHSGYDGYPSKGRIREAAARGFSLRHDHADYQGQNKRARSKSCHRTVPPPFAWREAAIDAALGECSGVGG